MEDGRQDNSAGRSRAHKKTLLPQGLFLNHGAGNRNRTYDLIITNDALYQLSYSGGVDSRSLAPRQG